MFSSGHLVQYILCLMKQWTGCHWLEQLLSGGLIGLGSVAYPTTRALFYNYDLIMTRSKVIKLLERQRLFSNKPSTF